VQLGGRRLLDSKKHEVVCGRQDGFRGKKCVPEKGGSQPQGKYPRLQIYNLRSTHTPLLLGRLVGKCLAL
jgi:hypothetical protein